jgi:hypothetical protein
MTQDASLHFNKVATNGKILNPCSTVSEFVIPRLAWNRLVYRHCKDTWNQEVYLIDFSILSNFLLERKGTLQAL